MSKKILRGFLIFSILFFSIGMFSVFGLNSYKSQTVTQQTNVESNSNNVDLSLGRKSDTDLINENIVRNATAINWTQVTANATGSLQQRLKASGKYDVYEIDSASKLGELANKVNSGNEQRTNAIFFLTQDIDLSNEYWTPIGTSSNKFQGIFFGNGHTIYGIKTNELSLSGTGSTHGFFGYTKGVVAELKVKKTNTGTNDADDIIAANNSGFIVDSVGTTTDNTGSRITSQSVNTGVSDGKFKRANNPWYEDYTVKIVGANSLVSKFDFYQKADNIVLRENATDTNVYPLRVGYKATTIPSDGGNITWTEKTVGVNFYYGNFASGYSNESRNTSVTFPYDQTFKDWFASHGSYKTRAGYTLNGIFNAQTNGAAYDYLDNNDYQKSYPRYNGNTYSNEKSLAYFRWAIGPTTFEVQTWNVSGDTNLELSKAVVAGNENFNQNNSYISSFTSSTGTQEFTITLNDGYEIKTDSDRIGKVSKIGDNADLSKSGIWYDFDDTGTDPDYDSSKTDDHYNPITITAGTSTSDKKTTYTITVNNLAGGNSGKVYLVVQRLDIKTRIDVNHVEGAITSAEIVNNTQGQKAIVTLLINQMNGVQATQYIQLSITNNRNTAITRFEILSGKLYYLTKKSENAKVTIESIKAKNPLNPSENIGDLYILSTERYGIDQDNNVLENNELNNTALTKIELEDDQTKTYFQSRVATYTATSDTYTYFTTIYQYNVGFLKTYITTKFYNENNEEITFSNLTNTSSKYYGATLTVNGDSTGQVERGLVRINTVDNDLFSVGNNGYYQARKIDVVDKSKSSNNITTINFTNGTQSTNTRVLTNPYTAEDVGTVGNKLNYEIRVYLEKKKYAVTVEYRSDDDKNTDLSSFFNAYTTNPASDNGYTADSSVSLDISYGDFGKSTLIYSRVEVTSSTGTAEAGTKLNSIEIASGDNFDDANATFNLTLGTFTANVTIYFTYKQVTVNVNNTYNGSGDTDESGTYRFSYTKTGNNETLSLTAENSIASVKIHSRYYLTGWEIVDNGTISSTKFLISGNYNNGDAIVDYIVNKGRASGNINKNFSISINPVVASRTVEVKYYTGVVNTGTEEQPVYQAVFYDYNNPNSTPTTSKEVNAGTVTYEQELSLEYNKFSRIGYTLDSLNSWNVDQNIGGDTANNIGSITNNKYSITGNNWDSLFATEANVYTTANRYSTWQTFISASETGASSSVNLTANWVAIGYYVVVDGAQSYSSLNVGTSSIYFRTTGTRDGNAEYKFDGKYSFTLSSAGYVTKGFTIISLQGNESKDKKHISNEITYQFTDEDAKNILAPANYFAANTTSNPIQVQTNRDAAKYTVTFKGGQYYTLEGVEGANKTVTITLEYNSPYNLERYKYSPTDEDEVDILSKFSRNGYSCDGFKNDNSTFPVSGTYMLTKDIVLLPTWHFENQKTQVVAQNLTIDQNHPSGVWTFYTYTERNIFRGGMPDGNNSISSVSRDQILENGEKITRFGYRITNPNNQTFNIPLKAEQDKDILNLTDLVYQNNIYLGSYTIDFYISVVDTLQTQNGQNTSYTVYYSCAGGDNLPITINENSIIFTGELHSIYSGTNEFVPSPQNDYGTFYFECNEDSRPAVEFDPDDDTKDYFDKLKIYDNSGEYNVGTHPVRLYLNSSKFDPKFGTNYETIFKQQVFFDNVENAYYISYNNGYIDPAQITLEGMTSGSAYYFADITTVVCNNVGANNLTNNYTLTIGSQVFTYTYEKVTLEKTVNGVSSRKEIGIYQGQENYALDKENFTVYGLKIKYPGQSTFVDFDTVSTNFEWNISEDFIFNLVDPTQAAKLVYQTKYLTASNGAYNLSLADSFNDSAEILQISDISVGAINIENNGASQFSHSENNEVLFSYVENGTSTLSIYINTELLASHPLSFNINVINNRSVLSVLKWGTSNDISVYANALDSYEGNVIKNVNTSDLGLTAQTRLNTYAVLSDVVKLVVDFNTGYDNLTDRHGSKTLYLSTGGEVALPNPVHPYSELIETPIRYYDGLIFAGYNEIDSLKDQNIIDYGETGNTKSFIAKKGFNSQTIHAMWSLNKILATQKNTTFSVYASRTGNELGLNEIAEYTALPSGASATYSLSGGGYNYILSGGKFNIRDTSGMAQTGMSGQYTLTTTVEYSDGYQPKQVQELQYTFTYTINPNIVGIFGSDNTASRELTFNNKNREADIGIKTILNDTSSLTTLNALPTANGNTGDYGFYVTVTKGGNASRINLVGTYIVTVNIDSALTGIYQVDPNYAQFTVTVTKFTIVLADYQDQINLSKYFGEDDPTLEATITIDVNDSDQVVLTFTRSHASGTEAIGNYPLICAANDGSIKNDEDKANYTLNTTGFNSTFEIKTPLTNLMVELTDNLTYTYNGYQLTNLTISLNNSGNYVLSGQAGLQTISSTFDFYYLSGSRRVEIPEDQKETYTGYISFSCDNTKNNGTYPLSVSLTESGSAWNGVQLVDASKSNIIVEKRDITLTSMVKTFDQTNTFLYNNKVATNNTVDSAIITNIVSVDGLAEEIEIYGQLAGDTAGLWAISTINLRENAYSDNYNLQVQTNLTARIRPSTIVVGATMNVNSLVYGAINNTMTSNELIQLLPLSFDDGSVSVANKYLTINSAQIPNATYSNGGYLEVYYSNNNVSSWKVRYSISSANYTFGETIVDNQLTYSKTYELDLTINQAELTLNNSSYTITKKYDGNVNVLAAFVGQRVNQTNGYYTSLQIKQGDIINVSSAVYADREIGTNKVITATLTGDNLNYVITQNLKGDITAPDLVFKKNGATITFADGVKEFSNTDDITVTYNGNIDTLISQIGNSANYLGRQGYTQTGWMYSGTSIAQMNADQKETFLQDAVDAGSEGITIGAIWQINTYTLTIVAGDHSTTTVTETTINYYSSVENIGVTVEAGYTFENATLSQPVATVSIVSGGSTRHGVFSVLNIEDNVTATIVTEEITIKIVIEYNNPEEYAVTTDTAGWSNGIKERIISYSELSSTDLPVLYVTTPYTYDFLKWQKFENNSYADSNGNTIWDRINGNGLNRDDETTGYTFRAVWTEAESFITVNVQHANVALFYSGTENEITKVNNSYSIHYNDNIRFVITSDDWYKWTGLNITGNYGSMGGDTSPTSAKNGTFIINQVKQPLNITVGISAINVTFTTSYDTPRGSAIKEADLKSAVYDLSQTSKTVINDLFTVYTLTERTYNQDYWENGSTQIYPNTNIQNAITTIHGSIPTEDITINLKAHFVGQQWTITFVKNNPDASFDSFGSVNQVQKNYTYGSPLNNLPVLVCPGQKYSWFNEHGEYYEESYFFVSSYTESYASNAMTFTANWSNNTYWIEVAAGANSNKIISVSLDGNDKILPFSFETLWDASKTVVFNLSEGYEIDLANSTVVENVTGNNYDPSNGRPVLAVESGELVIKNIKNPATVTVAFKAKDYTIQIETSQYETITTQSYNISYDENVSNLGLTFNNFNREGYTFVELFEEGTNKIFARYDTSAFVFGSDFVTGGVYTYDGDLTLRARWQTTHSYLSAGITPITGLSFNGTYQQIMTSTLSTTNSESVVKDAIFANGDQVTDIYYMVNGERMEANDDLSLSYRNAISNCNVYIKIEIKDTLSDIVFNETSQVKTFTLLPTTVTVDGNNLESYYSGTGIFYATENNVYGQLKYTDNTDMDELSVSRVEILDNSNNYFVGPGYNAKYYLNTHGVFNSANYQGITQEGSYWTFVEPVCVTIVKTLVTITVDGKSFENGAKAQIYDYTISQPSYVSDFTVNVNVLKTADIDARVYTGTDDFELTWTVTKNGDKTSNFEYAIEGTYEIVSDANTYEAHINALYFNSEETSALNGINKTITTISYDNGTYVIDPTLNNASLIKNGELIYTISNNGTADAYLKIKNGALLSYTASVDGEMEILAVTQNISVESLINTLNSLTNAVSRTFTQAVSANDTVYVVMTDYKAVLLDNGDKGGDQGYEHIQIGQVKAVDNTESWTGFDFNSWASADETIATNGSRVEILPTANILVSKVIAIWDIAQIEGESQNITRSAKIVLNADTDDINLAQVLVNGIENRNDTDLTYSFEWKSGNLVLFGEENGFTVKANTTSNGEYTLKITASKLGYASVVNEFDFNITVEKLTISSFTILNDTYTYQNRIWNNDISFTLSGNFNNDTVNLTNLLSTNRTYYLTMSGRDVNDVKFVGQYVVELHLDETVFNNFESSKTITVEKRNVYIVNNDVPAALKSKSYGSADPDFTIYKLAVTGTFAQTIPVVLTRQPGENVGTYLFNSVSTPESENFNVYIQEGEEITFTIVAMTATLTLEFDETLQTVYNGYNVAITLDFDNESGKWIASTLTDSVELTLFYMNGEEKVVIVGEVYKNALTNLEVVLNHKDAGTYTDGYTVTNNGGANFSQFAVSGSVQIDKRDLTITGITKIFDRTDDITEFTSITFDALVYGDNVSLSGKFNAKVVGTNINFTDLALAGAQAGNYSLVNPEFAGGVITAREVSQVQIQTVQNAVEYGQISHDNTIQEILALLIYTISIDGTTTDLSNNFITLEGWTASDGLFSSADMLKAGQRTIKVLIASDNFTGFNEEGYNLNINVQKKGIDLSWMSIVKNYDGTTDLPNVMNTDISVYIVEGDDVAIDKEASAYQSSEIGQNIPVDIVLKGDDKDNYEITGNIKGKINDFDVTFIVNATTEHEDLVTDGGFVDDGETPNVFYDLFTVNYNTNKTGEEILNSFTYPTRAGYTATGWKYKDGNHYVSITADNIFDLMEAVVADPNNLDVAMTIYTVWEIDQYDVVVSGEHLESFDMEGDELSGNAIDGYKVEYYSSIIISVVGEQGYKVGGYNVEYGSYVEGDFSDIGNTTGALQLTHVQSALSVKVIFSEIQVKVKVNINLPSYTERVDTYSLDNTYSFVQLKEMYKEDLPAYAVTAGTYYLQDFLYGELENTIGDKKLSEVVEALIQNITTDAEITIKAKWAGEQYVVTFDPDGGELNGVSEKNITFGQPMTGLPAAVKPGRSYAWGYTDGNVYSENDIFHSIGTKVEEQWTITLTAVYTNNTYQLTVNLGQHVSAKFDGNTIVNGQTFDIVYGETELVFEIETEQGYGFEVDQTDFNGEVVVISNYVTITNLTDSCSITINPTRLGNVLTFITRKDVAEMTVKVDNEVIDPVFTNGQYLISAPTEGQVEIILVAQKGTAFAEDYIITSGSGKFDKTFENFNKKLTIVWYEFNDKATLVVDPQLSDNIVSFEDISDIFETIEINGSSLRITGDNKAVQTNTTVVVTGTLKYGYKNAEISTDPAITISQETNTFNENAKDRKYHYSVTLNGINEDVVLSFVCALREYTFTIQVNEEQEGVGQITSSTSQTVEFGQTVTLAQEVLNDSFIFLNWSMGGEIISTNESVAITIDETLFSSLESTPHDEAILIIANYKEKIATFEFSAGNRGKFTVVQGEDSFEVLANQTLSRQVKIGADISFVLNADEGYEFDELFIDGIAQEESAFTIEGKTITIYLPADTTITRFEITFKSSIIYVEVDAAIYLNYEFNRYTTRGGEVYMIDMTGHKADPSVYLAPLEGEFVAGAHYRIQTRTNETLLFVAEPKAGFEGTFTNPTKDCVINSITIGEITIYAFSGVKQGTIIEGVFTAKQNKFNIVLVEEQNKTVVPAGRVNVDTTSPLIRASANNTGNVTVSIITGESLDAVISTGFAYRFDTDEFGAIKYAVEKKEESEGIIVTLGSISLLDPLTTGLTSRTTLHVENVDTIATLYIYVKAEQYNLRFYIDENTIVTAQNVLEYGKTFSLSGLSIEQKDKILAKRDGFTLDGYYTMQLGQGKKYVDGQGNPVDAWYETGYVFNGTIYEYAPNYDYDTKTFTVYPYWVYNKANVLVESIPEGLLRSYRNLSIRNVIVDYDGTATWISQSDSWYAQMKVDYELKLKAYDIDGYVFKYWLLSVDGSAPVQRDREFSITLEQSDYIITAVYQPRYTITIENSNGKDMTLGEVRLIQENVVLTGNTYDSQKILEIEALPIEGYKLLRFEDVDTGEILMGVYDSATGRTKYTYPGLMNRPLNIKAIFEGKTVTIKINESALSAHHHLDNVYLNGDDVGSVRIFTAKVGDELKLDITKSFGYQFEAQGARFTVTQNGKKYTLVASMTVDNLTKKSNDEYEMNISFVIDKEEIVFNIVTSVVDSQGRSEDIISSKIQLVETNKKTDLNEGGTFKIPYGESGLLFISANKNYEISSIYITGTYQYSINNLYDGEKIILDQAFVDSNVDEKSGYTINIVVLLNRLVWIMDDFRSNSLVGEGTEENPYLIRSEADMGYLAYIVNNGLEREDGVKYADCYYKLITDLDFDGRYFEPIGTKDNPFNGTLNLGGYSIKNVVHYKVYTDPKTQANGLVWCVGENAKIIQNNSVLVVTLSVIGSGIVASGATALGIVLARKRKRKLTAEL